MCGNGKVGDSAVALLEGASGFSKRRQPSRSISPIWTEVFTAPDFALPITMSYLKFMLARPKLPATEKKHA
jgi:hypothetical protein